MTTSYPPHLLDALGRAHAEAALDRLIKDEIALQAELDSKRAQCAARPLADDAEKELPPAGLAGDKSSDTLQQSSVGDDQS